MGSRSRPSAQDVAVRGVSKVGHSVGLPLPSHQPVRPDCELTLGPSLNTPERVPIPQSLRKQQTIGLPFRMADPVVTIVDDPGHPH